ncbi:acyl-CoA reductase [Maribacter sp. CXY002]|uniref:acyl-CoA reductase n=1 Tax=Maribacter luteocoastalis TaxID=3407671 RepID=UPI003B6837FE
MSQLKQDLDPFVKLGNFLNKFCDYSNSGNLNELSDNSWNLKFQRVVQTAKHYNGWFTEENIVYAFKQWSKALTIESLSSWLCKYDIAKSNTKTVAIIMAGNIPLVGFHDLLSVLLTGNNAVVKLSSNDTLLIPLLVDFLSEQDPKFKERVYFTDAKLPEFDAVIATGSNNTARYFEYYFGKKPHIIRKNRNSVAVLDGNESLEELHALGIDIFTYYGLGCRSVSKLFVPNDYVFDMFFNAIYDFKDIVNQAKYANNYDYNKAVYLMSEFKFLDNGFLMLKEDQGYGSPIATIFYEYYNDKTSLLTKLKKDHAQIQCVVTRDIMDKGISFGKTQQPTLWDYADGVDTVEFLLKTS